MFRPVLAIVAVIGSCVGAVETKVEDRTGKDPLTPVAVSTNAQFYKSDGSFDPKAAREAYFAMFRAFGYPIAPRLKTDEFWVSDFVDRDFARVGLGGVFWMNVTGAYPKETKPISERFGYCGMDMFLLPGQMIPEHNHPEKAKEHDIKMEGWLIRYGSVTLFSAVAGDASWKPISEMPKDQQPSGFGEPWFKCKFYLVKQAGETATMDTPGGWHFQRGGPNGAIVTEFATYHNSAAFSKPGMVWGDSAAKK